MFPGSWNDAPDGTEPEAAGVCTDKKHCYYSVHTSLLFDGNNAG
jgi:hypothetical protein